MKPEKKEKPNKDKLTADGSTGVESLGDIGIELDAEVLLYRHLLIPLRASLVDPVLERLTQDGEDDVADVGSGQLPNLPHWRKGRLYLLALEGER